MRLGRFGAIRPSRRAVPACRSRFTRLYSSSSPGGKVFCFGDGAFGQLGNGIKFGMEPIPTQVDALLSVNPSSPITAIAAGNYHCLAVSGEGQLFSWGWASFVGTSNMSPTYPADDAFPARVAGELEDRKVVLVGAGRRHTMAFTADNQLFTFGIGENGQLGLGNTEDIRLPCAVESLSGVRLACIAAGWGHSVSVTSEGEVFTWGWNEEAQCGQGHRQSMVLRPGLLGGILQGHLIKSCSAGADHTILIDFEGNAFGFGSAKMHQLGLGSEEDVLVPTLIKIPGHPRIINSASGFGHTILISDEGRVFTCGYNPDGQCGTGKSGTVVFPTEITFDHGVKIVAAAAGRLNSLFLDADGNVYSCGNASKGRLGNGARRNVLSPERVEAEGVLAVAAGMDHCMLLVR